MTTNSLFIRIVIPAIFLATAISTLPTANALGTPPSTNPGGGIACSTSKPDSIRIVGLTGYSQHSFTSWVARTNVTLQAFDANGKEIPTCGMKVTFKDSLGYSASCTTPVVSGGRQCQITRGYSKNVATSQWSSVSIEHSGVTHTRQVCKITAVRPSGWLGTSTHRDAFCTTRKTVISVS